ncbi:hypothetical protein BvCms565_02050 [Escherichia coli]|nr:hypothetical protein BvCms565_02050 [Escherichia coli]SQP13039.1 Uncharacterised protein [Escherichia coli]SQV37515.1 Uncharacterised protein [Escherichia coli]SQV57808.1 Uncharacterised protein [Escherichia coli]SQW31545.1 Uncharacterised protein [Escherichia coli]
MTDVLTAFINAPRSTQILTVVMLALLVALLIVPHLF